MTSESAVADPPVESINDRPVHLARCAECAHAVEYIASVTGASFALATPSETTYGIGEHGRPTCPNGHGEMAIADDQFKPADEAFTLAQAQLQVDEPQQAALPGVYPPFNYEAVFKEILEQAQTVEVLKRDYDDAKQEASDAKKSLDKAADLLMRMTLEFERRRKEKVAGGPPEPAEPEPGPRLIRCTWEAQHDGEACPLCGEGRDEFRVGQFMKANRDQLAATDAEAHVEDVEKLLLGLEVDEVVDALQTIDTYVAESVVREWSSEDRKAVALWADYQDDLKHGRAHSDNSDLEAPVRPAVLGKPHIPEDPHAAEGPQRCSICTAVLPRAEGSYLYQVTDYVGTECSGKAVEHRYPETGKKKASRKKAAK